VPIEETVVQGQEALKAGRWDQARACFERVLLEEDSVEALLGLADAQWWLGDAHSCVKNMERAYSTLREAGALPEAAAAALWLSGIYFKSLGNRPASNGWTSRAARIIEELDDPPLRGWLCWARAAESIDPSVSLDWAQQALAAGRDLGDRDLELCSLSELGRAYVGLGRVQEGMSMVDEAMAAALGGESGSLDTVVATCCSMMVACDLAADLKRIAQWCSAADEFMQTYGSPFLFADCRLRYGSVLLATGHWDDAERELKAAAGVTSPDTDYYHQGVARLATLRLRQGRLEAAEEFLDQIPGQLQSLTPLAVLHCERGEFGAAARTLARALDSFGLEAVEAAQAIDLLAGCHLSLGDYSSAQDAVEHLAVLAKDAGNRIAAHLAFARGRVALGNEKSAKSAESQLELAMQLFAECNLPYETAQVRFTLAKALIDQPEIAVAEAQGALSTFERLGASRDADSAASFVRSLGGKARTGPKDIGVLTQREQEVLRLVASGLSNPEIAQRLFISRKTASHHVSNLLSKLGLRNRAEAATYAARKLS
jgi:DNA-binding CsgD family transcriptional regulator